MEHCSARGHDLLEGHIDWAHIARSINDVGTALSVVDAMEKIHGIPPGQRRRGRTQAKGGRVFVFSCVFHVPHGEVDEENSIIRRTAKQPVLKHTTQPQSTGISMPN